MNPRQTEALLRHLDGLADAGELRRLGTAFARFMAGLGMQEPAQLLSCVLLSELEGRGHSCLTLDLLARDPAALLGWSSETWQALADVAHGAHGAHGVHGTGKLPSTLAGWRKMLQGCAQIWTVGEFDYQQPLVLDDERLYLRRYWRDETAVAALVRQRAETTRSTDAASTRLWLDRLFETEARPDGEPDWQKLACAIAVRRNLTIVTGGPGTGKTYTVARLLALLFALSDTPERHRIALAAPTGKAAARLKQAIDGALAELAGRVGQHLPLAQLTARLGAARTLHSLLGARPDTRKLSHHAGNPLDIDVLIVDEASMVHLEMMASLLDALPPKAMLILLGDKDQLASVEAGAVLGDLCRGAQDGGYTPETMDYVRAAAGVDIPARFGGHAGALGQQTVMLRHSRRYSGPIGELALAVNAGDTQRALASLQAGSDGQLAWLTPTSPAALLKLALDGRSATGAGYRAYLSILASGTARSGMNHDEEFDDGLAASAAADADAEAAADDLLALQAGWDRGADRQSHEDWARDMLMAFEKFRILCAVREGEWGVAGLNQAIEALLEQQGLIRRRSEWYAGRPVMITRNDYSAGVFNGDIGITLPDAGAGARSGAMRVYFLEGQQVRSVLATRLRHVETAFAMTVHKSQGSEFRHTVVVLPQHTSPVVTRELVYTGITRAREFFTLVTPNAEVFADAITRRTQRASGLAARLE